MAVGAAPAHDRRMSRASVSIGVAATLGPDLIGALAPAVERAGFTSLWVNDTPGADALAALGAAAARTTSLRLATGVLPLDRRGPDEIVASVRAHRIPVDRLVLGIGSGARREGALDLVRDGIRQLREVRGARIILGALGPRMRRLGTAEADGLLLSWLTPEVAAEQAAAARRGGAEAVLYVRTAFDPAGRERMRQEAERYSGYPSYAANVARLGIDVHDTVLPTGTADIRTGLERYRAATDEIVLRALVGGDDLEDYLSFVAVAAEATA